MESGAELKPAVSRLERFKPLINSIVENLRERPILLGGVAIDRVIQGETPTGFEQLPPEQVLLGLGGLILAGFTILEVASRVRGALVMRRLGPPLDKTTGLRSSPWERPQESSQAEEPDPARTMIRGLNRPEIVSRQQEAKLRYRNRGNID